MDLLPNFLILGASVRAAVFSAIRASLRPWAVDLFGDADLNEHCPCVRLPSLDYRGILVQLLQNAPQAPWMYTGALENRPALIRTLSRFRPLLGNDCQVLRKVRSPFTVEAWLRDHHLPCPRHRRPGTPLLQDCQWLVKPLASAGGRGIAFCDNPATPAGRVYFQEFIEGEPCAAVYAGDGQGAVLLGVTRQLIGEPWLNATGFHYCGSVGPLSLSETTRAAFDHLGRVLVAGFSLRGIFGVDCILRDGVPYPVEVNPRYTASVEVLEYATGMPAMALHLDSRSRWFQPPLPLRFVGKAILFARQPIVFPATGPWQRTLQAGASVHEMPAFADIPHAGEKIGPGQPILTCFARADSIASCVAQLRQVAGDLDRWLTRH